MSKYVTCVGGTSYPNPDADAAMPCSVSPSCTYDVARRAIDRGQQGKMGLDGSHSIYNVHAEGGRDGRGGSRDPPKIADKDPGGSRKMPKSLRAPYVEPS